MEFIDLGYGIVLSGCISMLPKVGLTVGFGAAKLGYLRKYYLMLYRKMPPL